MRKHVSDAFGLPRRCLFVRRPFDGLDNIRCDICHSFCAFPDNLLQADRTEAVVDVDEQKGERVGQRIYFDVLGGEVQAGGD